MHCVLCGAVDPAASEVHAPGNGTQVDGGAFGMFQKMRNCGFGEMQKTTKIDVERMSQFDMSAVSKEPVSKTPALLKSACSAPNLAFPRQEARQYRSQDLTRKGLCERTDFPAIVTTTISSFPTSRPAKASAIPFPARCRAVAAPIPPDAPVMSMTLSLSSKVCSSCFICLILKLHRVWHQKSALHIVIGKPACSKNRFELVPSASCAVNSFSVSICSAVETGDMTKPQF